MKKNNAITMKQENMKKIKCDLFSKDSALRDRVADFMQKKVWGIILRTRCNAEIKQAENSIAGLEKLMGSIREEHAKASIADLKSQIVSLQEKLATQLEEEAKFAYTEADNEFFKAYQNAETDEQISTAICAWFENYGFDVSESSDFLAMIMRAIAGERKAGAKSIVKSGATNFTLNKRTKGDVMGLFYGKLAEFMLVKGALKPEVIPEDVREAYAPKKKTNK